MSQKISLYMMRRGARKRERKKGSKIRSAICRPKKGVIVQRLVVHTLLPDV
jgi:hypothetical protein